MPRLRHISSSFASLCFDFVQKLAVTNVDGLLTPVADP